MIAKLQAVNQFDLAERIALVKDDRDKVILTLKGVETVNPSLRTDINKILSCAQKNLPFFTWDDSELIRSFTNGDWIIINGCENANPALLEKLNGLLEDEDWVINECFDDKGEVKVVRKHPDFRIFLIFNKIKGSCQISAPLRNRCLAIDLDRLELTRRVLFKDDQFFEFNKNLVFAHRNKVIPEQSLVQYVDNKAYWYPQLIGSNEQYLTLENYLPKLVHSIEESALTAFDREISSVLQSVIKTSLLG